MRSKSQIGGLGDDFGVATCPGPGEGVAAALDGDGTCYRPIDIRRLRVLVADDNRDAADSLSMLIRIWGHEVRVSYDGAAALELASDCQADVMLLDITMPRMNGYEVARHLRRQGRFEGIVLVAVTGWADQVHRLLGEAAGFDHYLIKPIDCSTLESLLELEHLQLVDSSAASLATKKRKQTCGILWCSR